MSFIQSTGVACSNSVNPYGKLRRPTYQTILPIYIFIHICRIVEYVGFSSFNETINLREGKISEFKTWGVIFRGTYDTLAYHSSDISSSKTRARFHAKLRYYIQIQVLVPHTSIYIYIYICIWKGGARGVMAIVVGIGHDDTSSNPGRDWLHFT